MHPQKWPEDLDYDGKRVVVIGSGATAVTLVPELAKQRRARDDAPALADVHRVRRRSKTRSPTGCASGCPRDTAYAITRWKNVLLGMAFYGYCRRYPEHAKKLFVGLVRKEVRGSVDVGHATSRPPTSRGTSACAWCPTAICSRRIRAGRASVVTDHIETFTEKGIRLKSGELLEADLIVTATGLKLKFLGGHGARGRRQARSSRRRRWPTRA